KTVRKSWDDAKTYCANLTLGGYSDWRLPNIVEVESIVDFENSDPSIDPTFQNTISDRYWSSSIYAGNNAQAWGVDFYDIYNIREDKTQTYYVRCVRDN
ncbi:MAG: DUF1566 domain-containing protein, partial [Epsilonproteobacteria bacterium]|nr:DUF1566 domain-containing protein [Campylobacterota bacterium]